MFCTRCGKKIDNDSTFCPFCGQKTDEPVEDHGGSQKPKVSVKMPNKKVFGSIAVVIVAVLLVFGIFKLIGGISNRNKSLSEKLFSMSWEERSKLSEADLKNMLKESGTLYGLEEGNTVNIYQTKTTEPFMGGDCIYLNVPSVYASNYVVRYETEEDFKDSKKLIENTLEKQLIKKVDVYETDIKGAEAQYYLVEKTNKNLDQYLENVDFSAGNYTFESLNELYFDIITTDENRDEVIDADKIHEMKDQYSVYKFVYVFYSEEEPFGLAENFPSDKSYTDCNCIIGVIYVPAREDVLISMLAAEGSYDFISGKKIDTDEVRESADGKMMDDYLDKYASGDWEYRSEVENEAYIKLYMMEKHNFDIDQKVYLKTDEEKRLWYIRNFNWDTDTDAFIDLSYYRDSSSIYCAAECNYNSDTARYFENELDKALYLADRDYKLGSGESFGGTDEKRLWFIQNYSYDTLTGKLIDQTIVDALIAYQKYADSAFEYGKVEEYSLIYINDDNIPECVIFSDNFDNPECCVLSYINGAVQSVTPDMSETVCTIEVKYTPKSGTFMIKTEDFPYTGGGWDIIELGDSFKKVSVLDFNLSYDDNIGESRWVYTLDGQVVSVVEHVGDSEYCYYEDQFDFEEMVGAYYYGNPVYYYVSDSVLEAYDRLRTNIYETNEYCIYEYELKDGVLTVKADDGANVSSSFKSKQPFEFSYPVSDDCVWQEGGHGYGLGAKDGSWDVSPESIEEEIRQVREIYDTEPDWVESPAGIQFRILDDVVIAVYTSKA